MIRKSAAAAIATIVVVIIVIAISITRVNAQVMRVEVLDQQYVGAVASDECNLCVVGGNNLVAGVEMRTPVESEVDVPTTANVVTGLVVMNKMPVVDVVSSVVCDDVETCVQGV